MHALDEMIQSAENQFHTNVYINPAIDALEKADKVKGRKIKSKYLHAARSSIESGLADRRANSEVLTTILMQIDTAEHFNEDDSLTL